MKAHMRPEHCEKVACGRRQATGRVEFLDDRLVVLEGMPLSEIVVADAFADAGPRLSEVHVPRSYIAIITIAYSWSCQFGSGLQLQAIVSTCAESYATIPPDRLRNRPGVWRWGRGVRHRRPHGWE